MKVADALKKIYPPWLSRVSNQLARGEDLRENFEPLLNQFYNMLFQTVQYGDPAWLDPVIDEWAEARTQSDLESRETSLMPILNYMFKQTFEVAREKLPEDDALGVVGTLLPVYMHASEYAAHKEMELNIGHISRELERANNRLEQLDKSKSDFIAIAAHELKTPLTLIEGYTAMLREQLPKEDTLSPPSIFVKGVDNGTRRLREIVNDMIDVSLIDNNMLSLHFQPIWLNRLLVGLKKEFGEVVRERHQKMEIRQFDGSDEMTFGDEERLCQAFRNVLSNAVKYTPDGGEIIIDGRRLPGFIEVVISDTGIGIDPENHTRVFEKFGGLGSASLHSSGKTKFKGGGPGLGLPICKGIIEGHGGAIWVESPGYNEDQCLGSTFHIMLPVRKVPPDDHSAKLFSPLTESSDGEMSN
jgi:signal transduction histidine kinase